MNLEDIKVPVSLENSPDGRGKVASDNPYSMCGASLRNVWETFYTLGRAWAMDVMTGMVWTWGDDGNKITLGTLNRVAECSQDELQFTINVAQRSIKEALAGRD